MGKDKADVINVWTNNKPKLHGIRFLSDSMPRLSKSDVTTAENGPIDSKCASKVKKSGSFPLSFAFPCESSFETRGASSNLVQGRGPFHRGSWSASHCHFQGEPASDSVRDLRYCRSGIREPGRRNRQEPPATLAKKASRTIQPHIWKTADHRPEPHDHDSHRLYLEIDSRAPEVFKKSSFARIFSVPRHHSWSTMSSSEL